MAGILTLAMIAATIIEKFYGTAFVSRYIYTSPVTVGLWALTVTAAAAYIVRKRRTMVPAAMAIHAAFGLILAGAYVTWLYGESGSITLSYGNPSARTFSCTGTDGKVLTSELPFELTLTDFRTIYYPGTSTPSDFTTTLLVNATDTITVSMNKIGSIRGYRLYQSGIGPSSTTLSIRHDPWGTGLSYAGYAGLFIAMAWFLWSKRRSGVRAGRTTCLHLLVCALALPLPSTATPRAPQKAIADRFGTLLTEYNGRIAPVSTLAREFCLKVHGADSYAGLSSEQIVMGWFLYYDSWKHEPFIKISGDEVRDALGATERYAALSDFYPGGRFALDGMDQTDRNVRAANEKVSLVAGIATGSALRLFPVRTSPYTQPWQWISWVDTRPADMSPDDWLFVTGSMESLARELALGRDMAAWEALGEIRSRQRKIAGATAPSGNAVKAEIFYNRHCRMLPLAIIAIMSGLAGLLLNTRRIIKLTYAADIALTAVLGTLSALRIWISGHLPLSNGYETMLTLALCAAAYGAIAGRRRPLTTPPALIVSGLSLAVAMMGEHNPAITPLMPVLASPLLSIHVLTVMTSYALFAIMAVNSAVAWCSASPERTSISLRLLCPATLILAAGIFTGAVWADNSWGRYWGWDPKETWALVTLLVYALPIHRASWPCFRHPRTLNGYLVLAFISVLITYFGVNFFLTGLHSYANQ